jgi:hypothetical protein
VVLNETSSSALNGQFPSNAFDLQNVQKHSFPLANWDPDCVIRAVRCPMAQTDVNLLHTDYTQVSGAVPGSPSYNVAGEVWGCFMGTGLTSMQAFRVETTLVYEFVGSQYTFSTSNNSTSSKGLEIVSAIKENLPAGVYERPTLEAQKAGSVAHAMVDTHGPKHAAGFASFLSKAGGVIGDVAKEVLPAVLGMALTAGTEGMIPPQVGYGLGREAFFLDQQAVGGATTVAREYTNAAACSARAAIATQSSRGDRRPHAPGAGHSNTFGNKGRRSATAARKPR